MSAMQKSKLIKFFKSGGCGCGPKSTDIIEPETKPKPKPETAFSENKPRKRFSSSSASSSEKHGGAGDEEDQTSTTFSITIDASPPPCCPENHGQGKGVSPCPKLRDSFAVIKDSDDPYNDFRHSMLQMIFEKEIYSRHDLQQLLDCFLQLNSPLHHEVIVKAFMEIWNGIGGKDETPS